MVNWLNVKFTNMEEDIFEIKADTNRIVPIVKEKSGMSHTAEPLSLILGSV
jgi:hypothetical protein